MTYWVPCTPSSGKLEQETWVHTISCCEWSASEWVTVSSRRAFASARLRVASQRCVFSDRCGLCLSRVNLFNSLLLLCCVFTFIRMIQHLLDADSQIAFARIPKLKPRTSETSRRLLAFLRCSLHLTDNSIPAEGALRASNGGSEAVLFQSSSIKGRKLSQTMNCVRVSSSISPVINPPFFVPLLLLLSLPVDIAQALADSIVYIHKHYNNAKYCHT